jgi:hypothetical protein
MQALRLGRFAVLAACACIPGLLEGQSAIDPSVAPRAAVMAHNGQRTEATDMLGRYLATAPYDAAAWLELGRLYLDESREWHLRHHDGDPTGGVLLDFATAAFDQALELPTDSGPLLRAEVEVDRAAAFLEKVGWIRLQAEYVIPPELAAPTYVVEFGRNVISSCPVGGVLVTGPELETIAVWTAALSDRVRGDLMLIDPSRWADAKYREAVSDVLGTSGGLSVRAALTKVSAKRPVCLAPGSEVELPPEVMVVPVRLVRVAGPPAPEAPDHLRVTALVEIELAHPSAVSGELIELYRAAARYNPSLCSGLLLPLGTRSREACGR